jgi:3-hydroxyacyl-[acyl-carrier-protein] dehydratase
MLLNDFYYIDILHAEDHQVNAQIRINPRHGIFEGHFPGQPVVPGVCMVQIVKELMEQHLVTKLLLRTASQLKFLQLVVPDEDDIIEVSIQYKIEKNNYTIIASFRNGPGFIFKMNGEMVISEQ